jgi:hypothetical protein
MILYGLLNIKADFRMAVEESPSQQISYMSAGLSFWVAHGLPTTMKCHEQRSLGHALYI